jgi:hypothetical protein
MTSAKFKGSKINESFVPFVRSVFDALRHKSPSPHACKLLLDLAGQYRGNNNGNLTAAWSVMSQLGWNSRTTLWRCKKELIDAGYVHVTRKGHMPSTCELLALTWFPLDVSNKFDPEALAGFKSKAYRDKTPLPMPAVKIKRDWTLPNGGRPVVEKHNPLSTAGTCSAPQVH